MHFLFWNSTSFIPKFLHIQNCWYVEEVGNFILECFFSNPNFSKQYSKLLLKTYGKQTTIMFNNNNIEPLSNMHQFLLFFSTYFVLTFYSFLGLYYRSCDWIKIWDWRMVCQINLFYYLLILTLNEEVLFTLTHN